MLWIEQSHHYTVIHIFFTLRQFNLKSFQIMFPNCIVGMDYVKPSQFVLPVQVFPYLLKVCTFFRIAQSRIDLW